MGGNANGSHERREEIGSPEKWVKRYKKEGEEYKRKRGKKKDRKLANKEKEKCSSKIFSS